MFGRRTISSQPDVDSAAGGATAVGKGRSTPTRKEAEAARKQRLSTPRTRKEQAAARKAQTKSVRERQRVAMATGDDAYLPARDKGPVKRYVRDYVDSRWHIGEILLPLFFVVFAVVYVVKVLPQVISVVWLVVLILMFVDAVRVVRGVKAGVRQRFSEADTKGVALYAVLRAWQMRRLRLPKPLVKHGDQV
ncbi:MAG: DUF3043 domain-containing protein [Propionibacteriales bacterium]|nr:DUF3043 domain-containing protein [Propionibacteriales bacterium]